MENKNLGPLFAGMVFNWVHDNQPVIICEVHTETVGLRYGESCEIDDLRPIPLTPEILRDWFGWPIGKNVGIFKESFKIIDPKGGYEFRWQDARLYLSYEYGWVSYKYVHELQRLLAGLGLDHKVNIK